MGAQRQTLSLQVGYIDKPQYALWRQHDVSQVERTEEDPLIMQRCNEGAQVFLELFMVPFVWGTVDLAQRLAR
ncbi:hypothetical protein D3C80_1916790 [compost metagenome]